MSPAPKEPVRPPTPPPAPEPEWSPLGVSKSAVSRFTERFKSNDFKTLSCQQVCCVFVRM